MPILTINCYSVQAIGICSLVDQGMKSIQSIYVPLWLTDPIINLFQANLEHKD